MTITKLVTQWAKPTASQAWQLVKLAQTAEDITQLQNHAETALDYLWNRDDYHSGICLAEQLLELSNSLQLSALSWIRSGEFLKNKSDQAASRCYHHALQQKEDLNAFQYNSLLMSQAKLLKQQGKLDQSLALLQQVQQGFLQEDYPRDAAIAKGHIARILVSKGEVDEALTLHHEEMIVYESLGDQRSRAVTLGDIARILVDKGEVDEALTLHHEEMIVYESLGDQRSRAVTLGDIARILVDKGEVDEALRLHHERKAVFESLGDQRERAATLNDMGNIALQSQDYQQALDYFSESYPVLAQQGDLMGIIYVGMSLGQLLCAFGDKAQAQTVLQRSIDGLEKLGRQEQAEQVRGMLLECRE